MLCKYSSDDDNDPFLSKHSIRKKVFFPEVINLDKVSNNTVIEYSQILNIWIISFYHDLKVYYVTKVDDNKIPVYEWLKKTSCTTDGHKKSFKDVLKHTLIDMIELSISVKPRHIPVQRSVKGCLSWNKVVLGGKETKL